MTITTPTTHPLAVFDELQKGAAAPAWIERAIVDGWTLGAGTIDIRLIAVSENATFRVSVAGEPALVVRVHRPGYVESLASVESELLWIEALLRETGIRTPAPVRRRDGELVHSFADPSGSRWTAVAFAFVTGTVLEDVAEATAHYREIGALTAVLHDHALAWQKPGRFERFAWDLDDLVGQRARWGSWEAAVASPKDLGVLRAARDRAVDVLIATEGASSARGLIHSDLRPSNIMISGDELTIIDFDDCGHSWLLYDFGAALTFYEHRAEAMEMAAQWLDGYREVRPLTREDLEQAAALSLIRRLTMLGWSTTHRPDALPSDLWEENLPGSVEVAARYLHRSLWMVDPV